jgi:starch synthase
MRVAMLAPEVHPYAKTGGLADVLAALPRALSAVGIDVTVCLPGYRSALDAAPDAEPLLALHAPIGSRMEPATILGVQGAAVPTVLVRADRLFDRAGLYGDGAGAYGDNAERFAFFCRAALEWLRTVRPAPDVLHVHDWHAALAPAFLRATAPLYPELAGVRSVLTIHNLAYQGRFPAREWHWLNLDARYFAPAFLEFWGDVSFLKAGIVFVDAVTTVSPRYAREIETPELGEGLDGVLRARRDRVRGILNGVDYAVWSPAADRHLPVPYGPLTLDGKARCKAALQAEVGLAPRAAAPLLAVVSRLVEQKGVDLLLAALPECLGTADVQLAVLGTGAKRYESALGRLAADFPGRVAVRIGFDEPLAHRLMAGADVFLMPSRYEPCGLGQLYALRYGTVPVAHAVGGLDDTVAEWEPARGTGTGFKFTPWTAPAFRAAIDRALAVRADAAGWRRLQLNGMTQDFSWAPAAREYARLYAEVLA